jgi:large subunit ribosomal protein L10
VDKAGKQNIVSSLNEAFLNAKTVVVTHFTGLTVDEITKLRKKLSELGGNFRVTKNNLAKLAVQGTQYDKLAAHFKGPTAIAYSQDPVAAAKGVVEFAKENDKLIIICGAIGGDHLDADNVVALAKLPSLDELRARIVGMISTPATRIAGVIQAPAAQIARVIDAHSQNN